MVGLEPWLIASRKALPAWPVPLWKDSRRRNGVHWVPESGKSGRSVGVIVHHVKSVYPMKMILRAP